MTDRLRGSFAKLEKRTQPRTNGWQDGMPAMVRCLCSMPLIPGVAAGYNRGRVKKSREVLTRIGSDSNREIATSAFANLTTLERHLKLDFG